MNAQRRPNLVLFMPETLRADTVFGDPAVRARTPNLDALTSEGVSFTNCFSQSPFCTPSRCSMFTGLYPHTLAHRSLCHLLQAHERNLFQDLKEAGYETVVYGKNDLLGQDAIPQCFDEYVKRVRPDPNAGITPEWWGKDHKLFHACYTGSQGEGPCRDGDWASIESALQYLDEDHDKPFCVFLPLSYAHPAYQCEEPFFSMHDRSAVPERIPTRLEGKREVMRWRHEFLKLHELTEDDYREIRATYFGMASRLDHQLGQVVDKLKERDLWDSTALFYFSDHGDYAGDYGLIEKCNFAFEDAMLHVPLFMRIPGVEGNLSRQCLVEMLDIYPTILELAGIESKHYHFGRSLIPLLSPDTQDRHRQAVFADAGWAVEETQCMTPKDIGGPFYGPMIEYGWDHREMFVRSAMVRTAASKYVYCPEERNELYDLESDPQEINNRAGAEGLAEEEAKLRELILRWLLDTCDTVPLELDPRGFV